MEVEGGAVRSGGTSFIEADVAPRPRALPAPLAARGQNRPADYLSLLLGLKSGEARLCCWLEPSRSRLTLPLGRPMALALAHKRPRFDEDMPSPMEPTCSPHRMLVLESPASKRTRLGQLAAAEEEARGETSSPFQGCASADAAGDPPPLPGVSWGAPGTLVALHHPISLHNLAHFQPVFC